MAGSGGGKTGYFIYPIFWGFCIQAQTEKEKEKESVEWNTRRVIIALSAAAAVT